MRTVRRYLVFILLLLAFVPAVPAAAATRPPTRVLLVVVDRTSLSDWAAPGLPTLHKLLADSAVGLMNSNTGGGDAEGPAALTIGASAHLTGPTLLPVLPRNARVDGTSAAAFYQLSTGRLAPPGQLLLVDLGAVAAANRSQPYSFTLGALATLLARHGITSAAIGNANRLGDYGRPPLLDTTFAALAMTADGAVAGGRVGTALNRPDPGAPFGLVVDNARLLSATLSALATHRFTVVTYGDTERANAAWPYLPAAQRSRLIAQAMRHFDRFLGMLLPRLPKGTRLILASPLPSWPMVLENATLTPVLLHGPGIPPGALSSGSTHRTGIVTNVDLAPTILHAFGIRVPTTMFGQPFFVLPRPDAVPALLAKAREIAFVSRLRQPLLHVVVFFIVLVYALSLFTLLGRRRRGRLPQALASSLAVILYLPFALLVFSLFPTQNELAAFGVVALGSIVPALLTLRLRDPLAQLLTPTLVTVAVLLLDLFTGQHLIKGSPLGYDPQIGARYYGIGNEYMGVLVGAAAVGVTGLVDRFGRRVTPLVVLIFAVIVVALITPDLGTKVGGAITATAAFGAVLYRLHGHHIGWREVGTLALVAVLLIAAIIAFDLVFHSVESRTDVGRTFLLLSHRGAGQAFDIIVRKLGTDLSLIQGSYWSILLGVAVLAAILLLTRLSGASEALAATYPNLGVGVFGALVGALVALLFNDTGVVAASTDIIFPVSASLLFAFWRETRPIPRGIMGRD
jgi:hypothetical protein